MKTIRIVASVTATVPDNTEFVYAANGDPVGMIINGQEMSPLMALELDDCGIALTTDEALKKYGVEFVEYHDDTGIEIEDEETDTNASH